MMKSDKYIFSKTTSIKYDKTFAIKKNSMHPSPSGTSYEKRWLTVNYKQPHRKHKRNLKKRGGGGTVKNKQK
jgi:hypothetical protein